MSAMGWAEVGFWVCLALVSYTYAGYPALLGLAARLRRRPGPPVGRFPGTASVVLSAFNEEGTIGRRARELADQLTDSGLAGEVIVVSDGSTDGTAAAARAVGGIVRVVELPVNGGKAAALNRGVGEATGDLVFFADARQRWAADAMRVMADDFLDPEIGAVSGDLVVEARPGVVAGVALYWRYEKWLRRREGRLHSTIGVTGAVAAVRRELFRAIPPGTILDDVYWPMQVVLRGKRVIHDERAKAFDRLPEQARDEFRRKVRTLSGNFQLAARCPALLLPWRNPVWWQFVSHKMLRLAVPWALIGLLLLSLWLPGTAYRVALGMQVGGYLAGLAGLWGKIGGRLASASSSFVVLNAAAWVAFWVWASGGAGRAWGKVAYRPEGVTEPT